MLAGAVDTCEGLFVEQTHQTMLCSHLLHDLHGQLVVVGSDIRGSIDGSQLVLGRGYLVVLSLCQNAQLPQFLVQVGHVGGNSGLDNTKVMIVHLLTLGGLGAEQGTAGVNQILTLVIHFLGNQEILLLGANGGTNALDVIVAKQLQDPHGLTVQGFHGAQQRSLLIQRLAAIGAESGGDAQSLALNERVRSGIPGSVASGLKGCPQTAGREAGSVRLTLDQLLAGEIHDYAAIGSGGDKAVVLLSGDAGERLEPMGKVGSTVGDCPVLHGSGNSVGYAGIQLRTLINGLAKRLINIRTQICFHDTVIKNQTAEIVGDSTHKNTLSKS